MNIKQCIVKLWNNITVLHVFCLLCIIGIVAISIYKKSIQYVPIGEWELLVPKDGPKQIVPRIEIELNEVEVIGTPGWNKFKTEYSNNEEVLEYIYTKADILNASQKAKDHLANMNEDQWNKFVESLPNEKAETIRLVPFALFTVYINNSKIDYYKNRIYCKGYTFSIPESLTDNISAAFITLKVSHIYDTFDELSGEREAVILKILEIKKNVEVGDK